MDKKEKKKTTKEKKEVAKVKVPTMVYAILIAIIFYLVVIAILIYFLGINTAIVKKTTQIIPYPAAVANGKIIKVSDLWENLEASRKFYENQDFSDLGFRVDFSTPDGKNRLKIKEKNILNKMIENAVIEKEAEKRGINLTAESVSQEVDKKIEQYGNREEIISELGKLYGWSLADFEKNIVKPDMNKEKLYEDMRKNDKSFEEGRKKIEEALVELKKGSDFESVVGKYSDGDSAKNRGDLGWFSEEEMLPEISYVAFGLKKGELSEVIESSLGYHIIKVEDKKTEEEQEKVHIKQIFIRTANFSQWLEEQEKKASVFIPIRKYIWDKENGWVKFRDENLIKFEENLEKNYPGDISVLF
ncbi:MAG TPA: peptidylprolyl isomerase [Candidatus Moranbacteria bacterium]|nr:peptidylprolyl isomerase [Candidatus Moranbacteria bacterium]